MNNPSSGTSSITLNEDAEPCLPHSYHLRFNGDWGAANFHRICSWLTQEFCDRAGPKSRTSISSHRDGGMDSVLQVEEGEADLAIATPAALVSRIITGGEPFPKPMPRMRALAVLPQDDRLVLAIDPKFNIKTFEDLRAVMPALRIATSINDGTNFIGYAADKFMEAHGVTEQVLASWGGSYIRKQRPDQCLTLVEKGKADAVIQEAIMTPGWRNLVDSKRVVPVPAEFDALNTLNASLGMGTNILPTGFWDSLSHDLPALDFSDFVVLVRDDMAEDVAYLLSWCLVETRHRIEAQYRHHLPQRSPLSYPLEPKKMAQTPIPLHPGAHLYYSKAGHI